MVRRDQDGGHRSEKSGSKIPGFRAFHGCVTRFHAFTTFHRLSIDVRSGAIVADCFLNDLCAVKRGPSFSREPRSNRARVETSDDDSTSFLTVCVLVASSFDERLGHLGCDSANGKQKGKTGRFGPIGPETAQCQLPHNIVTFGMIRARDVRVGRERGQRGERRSRFAISSRSVSD